jgi:hypothetical protein
MTDRTEALSLRAERTRDHLSGLVENLQQQITPAELLHQLVGRRATEGAPLSETIAAQVGKNPLACMLIAAGIGWLMLSNGVERGRPLQRKKRTVAKRASAKRRRVNRKRAA